MIDVGRWLRGQALEPALASPAISCVSLCLCCLAIGSLLVFLFKLFQCMRSSAVIVLFVDRVCIVISYVLTVFVL